MIFWTILPRSIQLQKGDIDVLLHIETTHLEQPIFLVWNLAPMW
jgi:hypothetical protein